MGGSSVFQALFHERAEGFFIDLQFRNAPPRPPVGPAFVGLGLEGELTNKWTKYKARNAVENQYSWKIHPDRDLGVPLAVSAMDYEGCYIDPAKSKENYVLPTLHPDDEALLNWKGSTGDTAAEQLQQKQDRLRAAARLAIAQGHGAMPLGTSNAAARTTPKRIGGAGRTGGTGGDVKLKKHHLQSRILDEAIPNFMKKTTYLTNTATSVHQFTSLAHTTAQRAKDVDRAISDTKTKYTEIDIIELGFKEANGKWGVGRADSASGKKRRIHPIKKKGVYPVWDVPLLPDVPTWGHTYTHLVVDHPPKNVGSSKTKKKKKQGGDEGGAFQSTRLQQAIVADVTKDVEDARMACTVWVPKSGEKVVSESEPESTSSESPKKKSKKGEMYGAVQQYDLDVVPLRDPDKPAVHYVWTIDPANKYAGYHSIGSRVQLSTGRPIVVSGAGRSLGDKIAEMATDESYVLHKAMKEEEKKDMDIKMAEVDLDLAEKYGLATGEGGESRSSKGRGGGARKTQQSQHESDRGSDSDESEADAF